MTKYEVMEELEEHKIRTTAKVVLLKYKVGRLPFQNDQKKHTFCEFFSLILWHLKTQCLSLHFKQITKQSLGEEVRF